MKSDLFINVLIECFKDLLKAWNLGIQKGNLDSRPFISILAATQQRGGWRLLYVGKLNWKNAVFAYLIRRIRGELIDRNRNKLRDQKI